MDVQRLLARLIIDGCVHIPDVVNGAELEGMQGAFERRAKELGKREMTWEDIQEVPELVAYIGHPRLMEVVDAFMAHYGQESVFANSSGTRDSYNPPLTSGGEPFKPFDLAHLKDGPLGWHDDVMGIKVPHAAFVMGTLSSLLYLDETFATNGAYCSAIGSHHLAYIGPNNRPVLAKPEFVLNQCELRPVPVKPGGVILYRAHHWHGVVPMGQRRRLVLQTFCPRATYDQQAGHTQVSPATEKLIRPNAKKYLCWYAKK